MVRKDADRNSLSALVVCWEEAKTEGKRGSAENRMRQLSTDQEIRVFLQEKKTNELPARLRETLEGFIQ